MLILQKVNKEMSLPVKHATVIIQYSTFLNTRFNNYAKQICKNCMRFGTFSRLTRLLFIVLFCL